MPSTSLILCCPALVDLRFRNLIRTADDSKFKWLKGTAEMLSDSF